MGNWKIDFENYLFENFVVFDFESITVHDPSFSYTDLVTKLQGLMSQTKIRFKKIGMNGIAHGNVFPNESCGICMVERWIVHGD